MVMEPQDETQFKVDIRIISFHVNSCAQYYLKSLAQQESPVTNVATNHQPYWRRDPRTSQMASSSPKMKNHSDVPHPQNLLGKSPPRNSLISHGKDMLHLGRFCKNADSVPPPIPKKRREKSIQVPPPKMRYTTYEKKVVYINIQYSKHHIWRSPFWVCRQCILINSISRFPPIIPSPTSKMTFCWLLHADHYVSWWIHDVLLDLSQLMDRQHSDPLDGGSRKTRHLRDLCPVGPPGSARLDVSQRVAILFDKKNVLQL